MLGLNQLEQTFGGSSAESICAVICIGYLVIVSLLDIRSRKLSVWILALGIGLALTARVICKDMPVVISVAGAAAGMVFLGVGRLTQEAFGYADGLVILALGIYLGIWNLLALLVLAFGMSAIVSAAALALRKFHRKTTMPFIPFLSAGYFILLLMGGIG